MNYYYCYWTDDSSMVYTVPSNIAPRIISFVGCPYCGYPIPTEYELIEGGQGAVKVTIQKHICDKMKEEVAKELVKKMCKECPARKI